MRALLVLALAVPAALAADLPPSDLNRIKVGQPAPDFTAATADGATGSLSQYRGKNVVLVFYRGQW